MLKSSIVVVSIPRNRRQRQGWIRHQPCMGHSVIFSSRKLNFRPFEVPWWCFRRVPWLAFLTLGCWSYEGRDPVDSEVVVEHDYPLLCLAFHLPMFLKTIEIFFLSDLSHIELALQFNIILLSASLDVLTSILFFIFLLLSCLLFLFFYILFVSSFFADR